MRLTFPTSFKTRLILLIVVVLLPAGFLLLTAQIDRMRAEKARTQDKARFAARLAATQQEFYIRQTRHVLTTIARSHSLVLSRDRRNCASVLASLKPLSPHLADLGILESDGTIFCNTLGPQFTGHPLSPEFVRRILENPRFIMSDLHFRAASEAFLHFAVPVLDAKNRPARFVYATMNLAPLSAALANVSLPPAAEIAILDRAGNVVAHRPAAESPSWVGRNLLSAPFFQVALARTNSLYESEGPEGARRVYALSEVQEPGQPLLLAQVSVPQKVFFAEADARFGASFVGMLLIGGLVLSLAWWYSNRAFLRPVNALLRATDRLAHGELTARAGVLNGKSELHTLAERFDLMAGALATRQKQLQDANAEITRINEELEDRVQQRTAELQALNTELEAFSYSVSHDLRAPLRHIGGFANILTSDQSLQSLPEAQRYLGLITRSASRMGTLIDDLLAFSRMGRSELAREEVDLSETVESVIRDFETHEGFRNVVWRIAPLPVVQGDASMLRLVWINLVSNAIKYSAGRQPAIIEIGSQTTETELIFSITDNGVGFDMAYADKLFGVFQRLHREDQFEGTGIGLANVRRIIHRHGGRAWAHAEPGNGATFYFSLRFQPSPHNAGK